MPTSPNNRRSAPRYEIDGIQGSLDGHAADLLRLSMNGLLAASQVHPEPERTLHVEFPLGDGVFRSAARVAFVGPDLRRAETGWTRVGVQFTAMPQRSQALLAKFLEGREPLEPGSNPGTVGSR